MEQDRDFDQEMEDFGFDSNFMLNDDDFDDDVCCWQIGYKYGNYCHCKAMQEVYKIQNHWFWGKWYQLKFKLRILYVDAVDCLRLFFHKRQCHNCKATFRLIQWEKNDRCPNCGKYDLPF